MCHIQSSRCPTPRNTTSQWGKWVVRKDDQKWAVKNHVGNEIAKMGGHKQLTLRYATRGIPS